MELTRARLDRMATGGGCDARSYTREGTATARGEGRTRSAQRAMRSASVTAASEGEGADWGGPRVSVRATRDVCSREADGWGPYGSAPPRARQWTLAARVWRRGRG